MADVMPDYKVSMQRLRMEIQALTLSIERARLEIMDIDSRRRKSFENIDATELAIAEKEKDLRALEKEHGKLDIDWNSLRE